MRSLTFGAYLTGQWLPAKKLRQLLRTAAGRRLFPLYWLAAITGMRRNEVLGLKWPPRSSLLSSTGHHGRGWW